MPPSRAQSQRLLSTLSLLFFALVAVLCLAPVARASDAHPEYGHVIGIGTSPDAQTSKAGTNSVNRFGNNILLRWVRVGSQVCAGSTNAYPISVTQGGRVEIIANDQGHRITPSWVSFTEDERLCVNMFPPLVLPSDRLSVSVMPRRTHSTPTRRTRSSTRSVSSAASSTTRKFRRT